MVDYVEVAEARGLPGLRLALTRGVPGPFSMAARAILDFSGVPYVPVAQYPAQPNDELRAWTGHRNAPVAVYNDEAPRAGWLEILNLAERLGSGPSLVPDDIDQRMLMIGLINEISGENGFIWNCRILMLGLAGAERAAAAREAGNPMYTQYGYSEASRAAALPKARAVLDALAQQLRRQRDAGSHFIVGQALTAADLHWLYFSQVLRTFDAERCHMPDGLRRSYHGCGELLGAWDELLIEHRERILADHPQLPMDS